MPDVAASHSCRRESVTEQRWQEHHRPLHPLGLVDGHDPHGVEGSVLVVLPALGVGVLGAVLEEVRERAVLLYWLGLVVDRLVVGNNLAELAEVVEDDLASLVRDQFLPDASLLEKARNTRWIEYCPQRF